MRLRIHHTLFAGFLGVVGVLVALIVLFAGSGLRRELRATFEADVAVPKTGPSRFLAWREGWVHDSRRRIHTESHTERTL